MFDMRFYKIILITILAIGFIACGGNSKPSKPLDTLKSYQLAVTNKDATTMKLLLSKGTLELHQQEAKAQGLTLDDIVLRDTLFSPEQKVFGYRNEKVDGETASVEVKNNIGSYDIIYLVLEDGVWKIDKKTTSNQMINTINDPINNLEDQMEKDRQQAEDDTEDSAIPDPNASPNVSPTDSNESNEPDTNDSNPTGTPSVNDTTSPPPPPAPNQP